MAKLAKLPRTTTTRPRVVKREWTCEVCGEEWLHMEVMPADDMPEGVPLEAGCPRCNPGGWGL